MAKPSITPSTAFRRFIDSYPSLNAAAEAWGVDYITLKRLMAGKGVNILTAFRVAHHLGRPVDELFTYRP